MSIIDTTATLQKYLPVTGTFKIENVLPFVDDAQTKYMRRYLGADLLKELNDFVSEATIPAWTDLEEDDVQAALAALLPYAQSAVTAFAFYLATPSLDVKITDSGFAVISNNSTLVPASAERVRQFRTSIEETGFSRVESLLQFLETNKADYPTWVSSPACTLSTRNLVNSTEEFDLILDIAQSRLTFQKLRPELDNVEVLQIEPVISADYADVLREEIRTDSVSDDNEKVLKPLRKAVVYLTAGVAIDAKYTPRGTQFLAEVKKILDASPDVYTDYSGSACYDATKTSYTNFENLEENQTFVFGG